MQVGSYVICVNDTNWSELAFVKMSMLPKKNHIYRVRRIIEDFRNSEGDIGIALEGIYGDWNNFINDYNQTVFEEYHFRSKRFREIESPENFVESILEKIEESTVFLIK